MSKNEYESLNLRFNCDDSRENVIENYRIICDEIGINYKNLVLSKQVHEDNIVSVTKSDRGNGIMIPNKFESADGLITADLDVPLVIFSADCVPIYFLDTKNRVIALSHSGWRGTAKNIAAKTVAKMVGDFNSDTKNIICAIAPSICEYHFETDGDVGEIFKTLDGGVVREYNGKCHIDLKKTIKNQLINSGIAESNITCSNFCTCCEKELFYSHRRMGGARGSLAAIMELKG